MVTKIGGNKMYHWIAYVNFKGCYRCSNCGHNEQLLFVGEAPEKCPNCNENMKNRKWFWK
jgi:rubrerythrin